MPSAQADVLPTLRRTAARTAVLGATLVGATVAWAAAAAAAGLPVPVHDPAHVRQVARDVVSRPEYRVPEPSVVARMERWIADQVDRLVAHLISGGRASVVAWGLLVAALAGVVVLVARFRRGVTPGGARPAPVAGQARYTADDWRAEALGHEAAGRWRAALRCRYRALVADLAERDVVDEVPGRTAGEYRMAVAAAAPNVAGEFAGVTELFELAWYGRAPTGPDDAARLADLADRVLAGAGR